MNNIINMEIIWRLIRGAFVTAVVETFTLQVNYADWHQSLRVLISAFAAGFLLAFGKGIRDNFGNQDSSTGLINKIPI